MMEMSVVPFQGQAKRIACLAAAAVVVTVYQP